MKVTIFKDLKEENWYSMNRYADQLVRKFKVGEFTVEKKNLTPSSALNLYLTRYLYYPLKARGQQGDVNHIVDHSYGHLVYALDPKKTVVTCHDLNPLKHEESWLNLQLFKYSLGGLKKAARIIADSEATKKDLIKFLEILPEKIKVIPLGVEEKFRVEYDQEELDRVRGKFNIPSRPARRQAGRKIILHVGGSAYNKNLEGIFKALAKLRSEPSSHLTIQPFFLKAGADFTESQKTLVKKLDLENCVKFLGEVSEEDLVFLYNLADCLVFPSFYEGFGLPILEAMACGTPVVTSNVSSMPEVAGPPRLARSSGEAGDAAVLVDPYDIKSIASGISQVLLRSNTPLYDELVRRGLEWAKNFTWQRTAEETFKVYTEIFNDQ